MANNIRLTRSPIKVSAVYVSGAEYAILTFTLYTGTSANHVKERTYTLRQNAVASQNFTFDLAQLAYDAYEPMIYQNELWYGEYAITQYNASDVYINVTTGVQLYAPGYRTINDNVNLSLSSATSGFGQSSRVIYWDGRARLRVPVLLDNLNSRDVYVDNVLVASNGGVTDSRYLVNTIEVTQFPNGQNDFDISIRSGATELDYLIVKALPQDYCKFDPLAIDFVNRYGIIQRIFVGARNTRSVNVTKEEYYKSPNIVANYITAGNQYQDFNVNGRRSIQVNTGFVSEEYNDIMTELLLSEYVFLVDGGTSYAVKPVTNSLQYKTRVSDKMINFTLDLLYTTDEIVIQ